MQNLMYSKQATLSVRISNELKTLVVQKYCQNYI